MSESNTPNPEAKTLLSNTGGGQIGFNSNHLIGTTIDGKYEIGAVLGIGGMGAVYRARHRFIHNEVAIKVIHPGLTAAGMAERFLREARTAALIDHPNAIKVTDFGQAGDLLYLVMEYVQGVSLREWLNKERRLQPTVVAAIMRQVGGALDAAHARQIVHRDLKPDNIMIKRMESGEMQVKVLDFGIAKLRSTENTGNITGPGTILGTVTYMSPEQCLGEEEIDQRSDVYSLGVVVFEMLTGRPPFTSATLTGVLMKHINEEAPRLRTVMPDLPEAVERVVARAMAKSPASRFPTAGTFSEALTMAVEGNLRLSTQELTVTSPQFNSPSLGSQPGATGAGFQTLEQSSPRLDSYRSGENSASPPATAGGMTVPIQTGTTPPVTPTLGVPSGTVTGTVQPVAPPAGGRTRLVWIAAIALTVVLLGGGGYVAWKRILEKNPAAPGSQKVEGAPSGMVLIPGGWLKMGNQEAYTGEQPVHTVYVDSFFIDQTEVTNEEFEKFVFAAKYVTDAEREHQEETWLKYGTPERRNHPVVCVSWNDALAYCRWAGKRLPTEAEWEYAARAGLIGKKYPWGDDPPQRKANFGQKTTEGNNAPPTLPVKTYDPSGYGLYDTVGNVWEWCADWFDPNYYAVSPERNPLGPAAGEARVLRGGSWYTDISQFRVTVRASDLPGNCQYDYGFRCAKSK